jgi:hypothetical protein
MRMSPWQRSGILAVALLAFGAARLPFEAGLAKELRDRGLTSPALDVGTRAKIGQTSSAIALGGLRTLVATFLNLRAFSFFEDQRWDDLGDTYDTIVDLAPRTGYYWDSACSHLAYDAESYYRCDSPLPALWRKKAWRDAIYRGRDFLERGIRNNPNDAKLLSSLGYLLSDEFRYPAFRDSAKSFADSAAAYHRAAATGKALPYVPRMEFYALARVPGRESEALALGHALYQKKSNRTPTLIMLMFVLEAHADPKMDLVKRATELFETPQQAYAALCAHWLRTRERFPIYGVTATLESLEKSLAIPAAESIFNKPLPPPNDSESSFTR